MKNFFKKLKNIIFVQREGLEQKWWHRLAQILIWGTTIAVLATTLSIGVFSESFVRYSYSAYSFQPNFVNVQGKAEKCYFKAYGRLSPDIYCGDIDNSTELIGFLKQDQSWTNAIDGLYSCDHGGGCIGYFATNDQIANTLIKNGSLDNIFVKKISHVLYGEMVLNIFYSLIATIVWFIFWESIIYRAIIYIVYGKRK